MKSLPNHLQAGAFNLDLVKRDGPFAVYAQSKKGKIIAYELIKIRVAKPAILPSSTQLPEREIYPNSEQFGRYAWSIVNKEDALQRLKSIKTQIGLNPKLSPAISMRDIRQS